MSLIDLSLIRTFIILYETGGVTPAAERPFVTQPSVSYALARLRELFDDTLFTRIHDGTQPIFVAEQLYGTFRESLTYIEGAVQSVRHFDPATAERRPHIAPTGLDEIGSLSLILERLIRDAPFVEMEVLPLQVDEAGVWLSDAKVDVAIYRQPMLGAYSQRVLHKRYVRLLSDRHPRIGGSLGLEQYPAERHIVMTRTSGYGITEGMLEAARVQHCIGLRVLHFSVLPKIIPGTELLTILPVQITYCFVIEGGMRTLELPLTLSPFDVSLYQHGNGGRSATLNWFRTTIAETIVATQH